MLTSLILIFIIKTTLNVNFSVNELFHYNFDSNTHKSITKTSEYLLLDSAYNYNSVECKNAFFHYWLNESDSIKNINHTNDSIRELAYKIFIDLFHPDSTSFNDYVQDTRKSTYKMYDSIEQEKYFNYKRIRYPFYRDAKYIILQSSVPFFMYSNKDFEKLTFKASENTDTSMSSFTHDFMTYLIDKSNIVKLKDIIVTDFAPPVSFYDKKTLICSDKYKEILDTFLLVNLLNDKNKFLYNTDSLIYLRRAFLIPEIEIVISHWKNYWHYATMPQINNIQINENITKAIVNFRTSYASGGEAYYEKVNNIWYQKHYYPNAWIE